MAIDSTKLNLFSQKPAVHGVGAIKSGENHSTGVSSGSSAGNNPFGGNTVGVNTNIGVGDSMNIPAQAGKKAGLGRTLGFA